MGKFISITYRPLHIYMSLEKLRLSLHQHSLLCCNECLLRRKMTMWHWCIGLPCNLCFHLLAESVLRATEQVNYSNRKHCRVSLLWAELHATDFSSFFGDKKDSRLVCTHSNPRTKFKYPSLIVAISKYGQHFTDTIDLSTCASRHSHNAISEAPGFAREAQQLANPDSNTFVPMHQVLGLGRLDWSCQLSETKLGSLETSKKYHSCDTEAGDGRPPLNISFLENLSGSP